MRDKYDAKTKYNIKRSELCLSMLIPSGEQQRCGGALCGGWVVVVDSSRRGMFAVMFCKCQGRDYG